MTEAEWLAATDPTSMLEFLRGKASDRKLRLFACAICRSVWDGISYQRSRAAVEAAERYADGVEVDDALLRAWTLATQATSDFERIITRGRLTLRDGLTTEENRLHFAANTAHVHKPYLIGRLKRYLRGEELTLASPSLLLDIFGNPFHSVAVDPAWLTSTVVALTEGIYTDRAFDRMPILADALQDAGCDNADILNHCRGPGPHVRGCWVVDLVLGKA